jgi:hypothetical protein
MFLDLERLGIARSYYPQAAYSDRRRLATKLGFALNELGSEPLEIDVAALLAPYVGLVESGSPT